VEPREAGSHRGGFTDSHVGATQLAPARPREEREEASVAPVHQAPTRQGERRHRRQSVPAHVSDHRVLPYDGLWVQVPVAS
jgi:hypothetical protein